MQAEIYGLFCLPIVQRTRDIKERPIRRYHRGPTRRRFDRGATIAKVATRRCAESEVTADEKIHFRQASRLICGA